MGASANWRESGRRSILNTHIYTREDRSKAVCPIERRPGFAPGGGQLFKLFSAAGGDFSVRGPPAMLAWSVGIAF